MDSYSEKLGKMYQNQGVILVIAFLAVIVTYPIKMCLHYDWGYRAVGRNIGHILVVLGAIGLFVFTATGDIPISPIMLIIMTAFLGLSVYHHIQTNRSVQGGHIIISHIGGFHSWLYPQFRKVWRKGRARLPEPVRRFVHTPAELTFQVWWESLGVIALGGLVITVDVVGGAYLVAAGVFLWLLGRAGQMLAQETLWNNLDGRNESEALGEATQYMLSPNKDDGDDDDDDDVMQNNVFGRAMSGALRSPKVAEQLRQAREQGGPSPWEVGVSGNHTNGAAQATLAGPQFGTDGANEETSQ